jgi:predicted hydrocarbon binding protein
MTKTLFAGPINPFIYQGAVEIIGEAGAQQVSGAGQRSSIWHEFSSAYGVRAGQGLALRTGRAAFQALIRQQGEALGLTTLEYRLLPNRLRLINGLRVLADWFKNVEVEENQLGWSWSTRSCPECDGNAADHPVCYLMIGFLQEFFQWASAGKNYRVEELECEAAGQLACVFQIFRQPVE